MADSKPEKITDRAFQECLQSLMDELGFEAKDLVNNTYVTERAVRYWLSGQRLPRQREFRDLVIALLGREFRDEQKYRVLLVAYEGDQLKRKPKKRPGITVGKPDSAKSPNARPQSKTDTSVRAPQILHPEIRPMPSFTGREDLLDAIDRALWQKGGAAALTNAQSAAVHGLGGVGKSVLAQEYAWRNRARYRGVWWLRAETEQTLLDDLIALGSRLIPGLAEIPERERAAQLAIDAIEQTSAEKPWLLIYDNAEKPPELSKLSPRSGAHRLITSRWPRWQGHAEALAVDVFSPEIAADFLMGGAPYPDRDAAARLAEALGYLPLALAHARAYCASSNLPFDRYRERIAERIKDLPDGADYPASVFATFSLSMDKVTAICPEAETLMGIVAFLAPDRIPLGIITVDVIGEAQLNKAVAALYNVSLITHDTLDDGSRGMSVHRLVQVVMRERLGDQNAALLLTALQLVRAALSTMHVREHTEWPRAQPLLPHAMSVLTHVSDVGQDAEITAAICVELGVYFHSRGDYANAQTYSGRALAIREKTLGQDHLDVGASLSNLAHLYRSQGRYEEAEPLYKRALAITEKELGPDHPYVATCLNNLAGLRRVLGRYEEAEPLFKRALGIYGKALGPNHPDVTTCLNNLAVLYHAQGRYEQAEPLYKSVLAIREKALGPDHPDVGTSFNNLGLLYDNQGRHAEAEPLYKRALAIREKALGPDHPDVGNSLQNLAVLCSNQGCYEEAKPLFERALAISEKALGPDHPHVATSFNNLAELYRAQGRYEEAESLHKRALAIREKALGPDHPDVGTSLNNLAELYRMQGRYEEAEPLYERDLAIGKKTLGPDHPNVGTNFNNLALLYRDQGRYEEAEPFFKRALAIREKTLGADHPDVRTSLNNLAEFYRMQGRYEEAEPLYERALTIDKKTLGADHPDAGTRLNNLGLLYQAQGRYEEAKPLFKRAVSVFDKSFGPDHPHTKTVRENYELLKAEVAAKGDGEA